MWYIKGNQSIYTMASNMVFESSEDLEACNYTKTHSWVKKAEAKNGENIVILAVAQSYLQTPKCMKYKVVKIAAETFYQHIEHPYKCKILPVKNKNPECEAADSFTQNWTCKNYWLVPPIHLVIQTIKHLITSRVIGTFNNIQQNNNKNSDFMIFKASKKKHHHMTSHIIMSPQMSFKI